MISISQNDDFSEGSFPKFSNFSSFFQTMAHEGFGGFSYAQFVLSKGFGRKFHVLILKLSVNFEV